MSVLTIAIASCGGGTESGGSNSPNLADSKYFTKTALGNTWTWSYTRDITDYNNPGNSGTSTWTETDTITAKSSNSVTINRTFSNTSTTQTLTVQLNSSGDLIISGPTGEETILPASFSVGTTWISDASVPVGSTIKGINVTCTSPAGTFSDCIEISTSWVSGTIGGGTYYFSPSVGYYVSSDSKSGFNGVSGHLTSSLQPGFIANPK